jgi:hypothetical protein
MTRSLPAVTAALLATLAAAPAAQAVVQIDRGIAGVRLDNSRQEVRAALGKPSRIVTGSNEFGPYTQFRYRRAKIVVTFQGNAGVTNVSTTGLGDRTARGVGVGSTEQAVKNRVGGITCETSDGVRLCRTKAGLPGQRLTDFFIKSGKVSRINVGIVID